MVGWIFLVMFLYIIMSDMIEQRENKFLPKEYKRSLEDYYSKKLSDRTPPTSIASPRITPRLAKQTL